MNAFHYVEVHYAEVLAQPVFCDIQQQFCTSSILEGADIVPLTKTKAPFTLRSIFGTARIKLVPVTLFWFLHYLFR
jgi:hypothetical protein